MNKFKYMVLAAAVGMTFTACEVENDNGMGMLDGIGMVNRSISLVDGSTVRAAMVDNVTIAYNNLVGINADVAVTLNGKSVTPIVDPANHTQVIIPLSLEPYQDYVLEIPQGAFYRSDDKRVEADAVKLTFNTKTGINPTLLSTSLINPNASAEAKKVYQLLLDNYGVKQLSGSMGEVAWGTGFSDLVASNAGKYPAIVGFDYIHLASSPSNWIDYGDITPVKEVWDAGSIPTITWHWNVPTSQPGVETVWSGEKEIPSDWSGYIQLTDEASLEVFSKAVIGAVLTVHTKDVAAGAQGSVKNSGWTELASGLDYFEISGDYSVTLDAAMAAEVKKNGVIIAGHDYTVTGVSLTIPAGGSMSFNAKSDEFVASNVLVDGSWENQVALADVEKLAGYLKLLQDAGIPVLWRPFHEAAGDYTWGAWFWWGNSGVEVTKQLWSWLYDKLTVEYGLNNLIWVWTIQTSDAGVIADQSKILAAYPGDDKVDIVGADLYVEPLTLQTDQFDTLYKLVGGKKIVALTECGNLLDVDAAFNDGALWSFFMGWYEQNDNGPSFIEWNTNGEWSTVLNNARVLNRGDFSLK